MPSIADKRNTFRKLHEAAASSFPIRGTSAARAICRASASRRWRRPAPAMRIRAGLRRRRACARRGAGALPRDRRGDRRSAQRRFRERLCRRSRRRRRERDALHRDRRGRAVDRGFDRRSTPSRSTISTLRWRACERRAPRSTRPAATWCSPRAPKASSAAGPTSTRRSAGSRPSPTPAPIASISPGIKTREQIEAVVKAVGAKPVNFLDVERARLHRRRSRGNGRAPHQRRRHARARGLDRVHAAPPAQIAEDGKFDSFAGVVPNCGAQRLIPRRSETLTVHILITGAAGMIGRKLTDAACAATARCNGKPIDELRCSISLPRRSPRDFGPGAKPCAGRPRRSRRKRAGLIAARPDVIFHLAGVVSGEAELDFERAIASISTARARCSRRSARRRRLSSPRWSLPLRSRCSARRFRTPFPTNSISRR